MNPVSYVNGYECASCTEISLAKRGLDPRNPDKDPVKQEALDLKAGKIPTDTVLGKESAGITVSSAETSGDAPGSPKVDFYV